MPSMRRVIRDITRRLTDGAKGEGKEGKYKKAKQQNAKKVIQRKDHVLRKVEAASDRVWSRVKRREREKGKVTMGEAEVVAVLAPTTSQGLFPARSAGRAE